MTVFEVYVFPVLLTIVSGATGWLFANRNEVISLIRAWMRGEAKWMTSVSGEYFLVNLPTRTGVPKKALLSRFEVRKGIGFPRCSQRSFSTREVRYRGTLHGRAGLLSAVLHDPKHNDHKFIVFYEFSEFGLDKIQTALGFMTSVNYRSQPWKVPVIISDRPISSVLCMQVLDRINTDVLDEAVVDDIFREYSAVSVSAVFLEDQDSSDFIDTFERGSTIALRGIGKA